MWSDLGGEQEKKRSTAMDPFSAIIDALPTRPWVDVKIMTDAEKEASQFQ